MSLQLDQRTHKGDSVIAFQNEDKTDITERVKDGRTKVFNLLKLQEAQEYARLKGSYVYDVFAKVKRDGRMKYVFFGAAVPN